MNESIGTVRIIKFLEGVEEDFPSILVPVDPSGELISVRKAIGEVKKGTRAGIQCARYLFRD